METYQFICPTTQQFQQPSRQLHNEYDSNIDTEASENRFCYQHTDQLEENTTGNRYMNEDEDLVEVMKGFLNEVDVKGHEMFEKFVARVEKDVPMREILHDFGRLHGSDMLEKLVRKLDKGGEEGDLVRSERGVDGEELQKEKLERFRVKTVNTIGAGVVKEEGQ